MTEPFDDIATTEIAAAWYRELRWHTAGDIAARVVRDLADAVDANGGDDCTTTDLRALAAAVDVDPDANDGE